MKKPTMFALLTLPVLTLIALVITVLALVYRLGHWLWELLLKGLLT